MQYPIFVKNVYTHTRTRRRAERGFVYKGADSGFLQEVGLQTGKQEGTGSPDAGAWSRVAWSLPSCGRGKSLSLCLRDDVKLKQWNTYKTLQAGLSTYLHWLNILVFISDLVFINIFVFFQFYSEMQTSL